MIYNVKVLARRRLQSGPRRHDGYKTSKWRYKMHVISNAKIDFLRFWFSTILCCRASIRENSKLT